MSIENNLKRIADSLEQIALVLANPAQTVVPPVQEQPPAPPVQEQPPAPPAQTQPPAPPAQTQPTMSVQDLNAKLVEHFNRLGGDRTKIDAVLVANGVRSVADLDPSLYSKVLDEVAALQP